MSTDHLLQTYTFQNVFLSKTNIATNIFDIERLLDFMRF